MSQAKVEQRKAEKQNRKNWKAEQKKKKIIGWAIALVCVAVIVVVAVFLSRPDYSMIPKTSTAFDEVAVAQLTGYDGISLSEIARNLN